MRRLAEIFWIHSLFMIATTAHGQIAAPGAELKLVADGYKFTEGPTADDLGNVYFTDQPNDRIIHKESRSSMPRASG